MTLVRNCVILQKDNSLLEGGFNNLANKSLEVARKDKVDEFYTQLSDIEAELKHYKRHFNDKVVFVIVMILMKVTFSSILQ